MRVRFCAILLCLSVLTGSASASFDPADNWTVTSLGTLGGVYSLALGMNESSQVVGYSYLYVSVNWRHAFLWDDSQGMLDLGTSAKHSYGFGINNANPVQVVGYNEPDGGSTAFRAFLWDSTNGMQDLGTLGGDSSVAMDINDSAQVAGYSTDATGTMRAFLWDEVNGIQDLGTLGGPIAYGFSINDSGQVVGRSQASAEKKYSAFIWDSVNGMQSLSAFPGGKYSNAFDINGLGVVVGEAETKSGAVHAVLWETKKPVDLGTLGGAYSSARAVSDSAQIVGKSETVLGEKHAVGWDNESGTPVMTDLNALLPAGSGWVLMEAWDINSAGDVAGWGKLNGVIRAFLLQKQ